MSSPIAPEPSPLMPHRGDEPAIILDSVSVRYRVSLDPRRSLKEVIVRRGRLESVNHVAIDELNLTVQRGEILGIIGRNGAGKTTLLNVMARIFHPSSGRLRVFGTVSPLIDLLGGFHPELTGRENVLLRGAFLGIGRREMNARMDDIATFADIGRFFDAPLRTYSAGMTVRLAFAVATAVDGDILLIDEALGVGDAEFQKKCAERMDAHRRRGVTLVVVSHDIQRLTAMCDRILWLDHGRARRLGAPHDVVADYIANHQHP
jgi:lipopolysaccharide transport system ATP-binding protein